MAQKKDDLPVNPDVDLKNGGTISYATEVISTIAGVAANEIEGIAGMCISGGLSDIIGRNRNMTRGVKAEVGSEEASFDLYVIVEYGQPIQKVCHEVQENVRKAIESMTGLHVARVDVHVQGVSFEKEKQQTEISIEAAKSPALTAGTAEAAQEPKPARPAKNAKKTRKKAAVSVKADPADAGKEPEAGSEEQPAEEDASAGPDGNVSVETSDPAAKASEEAREGDIPAEQESVSCAAEGDTAAAECPETAAEDECVLSDDDKKESEADEGDAVSWTAGPAAGSFSETASDPGLKKKTGKKNK